MSFGGCPQCCDTICTCGYKYRDWTRAAVIELRDVLNRELARRETEGEAHEPPGAHSAPISAVNSGSAAMQAAIEQMDAVALDLDATSKAKGT